MRRIKVLRRAITKIRLENDQTLDHTKMPFGNLEGFRMEVT